MKLAVLLYDGDCGFCCWTARKVISWDRRGRLRPVALQDPEAEVLLASLAWERRMASWHLVTPEGRVHSGGAAIEPLMRLLPGGTPVAWLAASFPGAAEDAYRWVARNRGRLGRLLGVRGRAAKVSAPCAGPGEAERAP